MFVLLVGPKGSGKSHIGCILEQRLGVLFFHVEPLWMDYYAECRAADSQPNISDGIARVHPKIVDALQAHKHVCVETTGASVEILDDLLSLYPSDKTLVVRVSAPLALCLTRIAERDPTHQIQMDMESIRKVYELSIAAPIRPALVLENRLLSVEEIVTQFQQILSLSTG